MRVLSPLLLLVSVAVAQEAPGLLAGVARYDITPSGSVPMYGYDNRKCGLASGTHDPLFARVLILDSGGSRLAIVTLDLGSIVSERLHRTISSRLGIPVVLLSASHTHSAPAFLPSRSLPDRAEWGEEYLAEVEQKIFDTLQRASKSMFPARLAVGRSSLQLGYNRLQPHSDGRSRVLFRNPERIPYGPVDPEIVLLRIEDIAGRVRALVVHYAVHPVVLGQSNCKFSADYPGAMQAVVQRELNIDQVMFVQGGAGDINPLLMGRSENEATDFAVVQTMGQLLATEVINATRSAAAVQPGAIQFRQQVLEFRNRWSKAETLTVGITTVLIGKDIAIAAVPGEPMHRLQRLWKEQAEVAHPLFYGYTYSNAGTWPGYIPDLRSAARGGYGADASTSIEVGAGERIIQQHLINLYDMQGMWRESPGRP